MLFEAVASSCLAGQGLMVTSVLPPSPQAPAARVFS